MSNPHDYTVGWICAISTEYVAARAFLDEEHDGPEHVSTNDNNDYTLGKIGRHNVVIAVAPDGEYGTQSAATVARDMMHSFTNIRIGLMVGIAGGAPSQRHDIRLGDIVVSAPRDGNGGVVQYDFGKATQNQDFLLTGFLNQPPPLLRAAVAGLRAQYESDGHQLKEAISAALAKKPRLRKNYSRPASIGDFLFWSDVAHPSDADDHSSCAEVCNPSPSNTVFRAPRTEMDDNPCIYYGLIASANRVMKDALARDTIAAQSGVLCFEMEAAGLMNHFPCLVIRGICDYSDSHKNKQWQGYAAMTAAAYAKDLLCRMAPNKIEAEKPLSRAISQLEQAFDMLRDDHTSSETKRWLDAPDAFDNHSRACAQRHRDTGFWFLDGRIFAEWTQGEFSCLWLRGPAGCGKSVLCSSAIELITQERLHATDTGVAFYYFSFGESLKQDVLGMLRALIQQLSDQLPSTAQCSKLFRESYKTNKPSTSNLCRLLQAICREFSRIFIFIDALDEVPDGKARDAVLSVLIDMVRWQLPQLQFLITSRDLDDIRMHLDSVEVEEVVMKNGGIDEDIVSSIRARLSTDVKLQKWQDYHEMIEQTLTARADGVFRWVDCQLQSLARLPVSESILERCLTNLPATLDETYERMLDAIEPDFANDAKQLLTILCFSSRALRVDEVTHALAINLEDTPRFENARILKGAADLRILCPGLIEVDDVEVPDIELGNLRRKLQYVRVSHFSVQQYLLSSRIRSSAAKNFALDRSQAHADMARICSVAILQPGSVFSDVHVGAHCQLAKYAISQWHYHYLNASSQRSEMNEQLLPLIEQPYQRLAHFVESCQKQQELTLVRSLGDGGGLPYGYREIIDALIAQETGGHQYLSGDGGRENASVFECLLYIASANRKEQVIYRLLNVRFNDNTVNGFLNGRPLLQYAVSNNLIGDARALLRAGADPNVAYVTTPESFSECFIQPWAQQTPFHCAIRSRRPDMVEVLLEFGADVDVQSQKVRIEGSSTTMESLSALEEAIKVGDEEIITLLKRAKTGQNGNAA